jgi:hypothetical protein
MGAEARTVGWVGWSPIVGTFEPRPAFAADGSYLVDPASHICLSQRLSHACPSIKVFYT